MNKLIIALVAGTFAAMAGAQTPAADTNQMKQQQVQQTTKAAEPTSGMKADEAQKNVDKSKKHAKNKNKKHKQDMAKDTTSKAANANTGATTSMKAEQNTAASKADSATKKAPPTMGTPANENSMQKASKP
ncbi:MAG TPA: hypothetical protein VIH36_10860 [Casimicrobiaceae bacterium]|jgi:hypothetical protein